MSKERLKHPFGRENEVSVQLLFKSFCNHVHLGQWELASSCVKELNEQKDILGKDIGCILRHIARYPHGKSLPSDAVPSPHHLAWLCVTEIHKLNTSGQIEDSLLLREVEFRLLLFDSCQDVDKEVLQELYDFFRATLPTAGHESKATMLSPHCLEYLLSVVLTNPTTGHYLLLSLFNTPGPGGAHHHTLNKLELQALQVLLTEIINTCSEQHKNNSDLKDLHSRFCDLLVSFNPGGSDDVLESFIRKLVSFLYSSECENLLTKRQVLTCLSGRTSLLLLQLFFKTESFLQESGYVKTTSDVWPLSSSGCSSSVERTMYRDQLVIGLSQHKDRQEAWRDLFFYCYKCEKHFLELVVEVALHLMQTGDTVALGRLFHPVEFHPLKPVVLLLGWEYCCDVQTARDVLDLLWDPQTGSCLDGISATCGRLSYQVQLTQWCLSRVRSLSGASQQPIKSNLKSFFRGLELHSALYLLHHSTRLAPLVPDEVIDFLRESPATTELENDSILPKPEAQTVKQVQFALDDEHLTSEPSFNAEQEKDTNVYRAFCVLKSFMDIMIFSGEVDNPWVCCIKRDHHKICSELHQSPGHSVDDVSHWIKSQPHSTDTKKLVMNILKPSESVIGRQASLEMQRYNYVMLYKQNVLDVLARAKQYLAQLYPLNYRLEVIQNVFSLLLATHEDITEDLSWDSGEEGAEGDRSDDKFGSIAFDLSLKMNKDDNRHDDNNDDQLPPRPQVEAMIIADDGSRSHSKGQGHCSTASNHSVTSTSGKLGFLANEFILRDILLSLRTLLDDLGNITQESSSLPDLEHKQPTKYQLERLDKLIECCIPMSEMSQHRSQLSQYVSEALWRFQLISSDCVPKDYGALPSTDWETVSSWIPEYNFQLDDEEEDKSKRKCKNISGILTDSNNTLTTDGSQSGASTSSTSSHRRHKKRRRHKKSWIGQSSEPMDPVIRMLSDKNNLLNVCLQQGRFGQALQVVKMFNMEKTSMAKEAMFAEQYDLALKRLRSEDIAPGHQQVAVHGRKSHGIGRHSMAKSSLSVIANVAAAGISSMSVSNSVDQILGLSDLPAFLVEHNRSQPTKTAVGKLCQIFLDPANIAVTIILDLACTATSSWEKSQSLVKMADTRLPVSCKADMSTLAGLASGDSPHRLQLSLKPAYFGYGKFLLRVSESLGLAAQASDSFLPYYCRGLPNMLTSASLPLDSFDLQRYAEGMVAIKKELYHVTKITREHGIWPYRGVLDGKRNSRDSSSVLTAVKSLLATVQRTVPSGGWIEQLLHRTVLSPDRNYLQALVNHVVTLAETVARLSTDSSHSLLHEPFHVLKECPIKLLGALIFEAGVDPTSLESVCQVLHIDLTRVLLESSCPQIPVHCKPQIKTLGSAVRREDGRLILNDSGNGKQTTCRVSAERLVRLLLTRLVHQMKETIHCTTKEEIFSVITAEALIASGHHKDILLTTNLLQTVDLNSIVTSQQRTCFYGNLLTLMGIHIWLHVIETGKYTHRGSHCSSPGGPVPDLSGCSEEMVDCLLFQNQMAYKVGQLGIVSYFDLRYLVTRQGLAPPSCFRDLLQHRLSSLDHCDPWVTFGCNGDPCMTFALADGTPTSPRVQILNPELVEYQLTCCLHEYISQNMKLDIDKSKVSISPLLAWYVDDFDELLESVRDKQLTINDVIRAQLPEGCREDVIQAILNKGSDHMFKIELTDYHMTWPTYTFTTDTWRKQQRISASKESRRPSLPEGDLLPMLWPQCKQSSPDIEHVTPDLYVLSENTLEYLANQDEVLAAVVSIVCHDGSDSIGDHLLEDHFQLATQPAHDQEQSHQPEGSKLEEFRQKNLAEKYPLLSRHIKIHGSLWLTEGGESHRESPTRETDVSLLVVKDLSFLDLMTRVCLLLNPDSEHCQGIILQKVSLLLEHQQWSELMRFFERFTCRGLTQDLSQLRLLHDYCMCCVVTADLEMSSSRPCDSSQPESWKLLLRICDSELKCKMILGLLQHWEQDVCLQLLNACVQREANHPEATALQKLVVRRLAEMKVYKKITSCAKEVLSKLDQSEPFTISGQFSQITNVDDAVVVETEDPTNQVLRRLSQWQEVVDVSSQSPAMVLEVLTFTKDFETAYEWAHIYGVNDKFEQILKEVHVLSLLEKSPSDVTAAYQVLNELRGRDAGRCFDVCNNLTTKLTSKSHILSVVEYMITQLKTDLGERRLRELTTLSLGCKAVLSLPTKDQADYEHLVSAPMLLLEQLLMNNKLEWAKLVLTIYTDAIKHSDSDPLTYEGCDNLLEEYATKALDFPLLELPGTPGSLSRSLSKTSLMSPVPSGSRLQHKRNNTITALSTFGLSKGLHRTGSASLLHSGGAVGSLPLSATDSHQNHGSSAQTSASIGSRAALGMRLDAPFIMPADPPSKAQWVSDSSALVCMVCQIERFSMLNRRHHCRRCGRVVCGSCSMKTTIICGKSSRTCDQCYRQIYPPKDAADHLSDLQRLRDRLSNVSPDGSLVNTSRGNIGITIGSASPTQNQPISDCQLQTQQSCSECIYVLSLDDETNNSTRAEFYYDYAPSTSLCLSLLDLHSRPEKCAQVLLTQCEDISKHLQPIAPGVRNPEVDYGLVISMMKTMLMSAKIRFIKSGDASGVSQCGVYIDRVNLLDQLLSNNCTFIPSIYQLTKQDTLRRLRDCLIQEERFSLAMDVSTKCGLESTGVWVAWGKACIRVGDYPAARDKFAKCLKRPMDLHQIQNQSINKILNDVIECVETASSTVLNKFLENLSSVKSLLADPAQRPVEDLLFDEPQMQECLYYLRNYGNHVAMVTFYRHHKQLLKAAHYILDQKCSSDVFLEGLFLPCLSSGNISQLFEQLHTVDPSLERWLFHLTATCKHLTRSRQIHVLYQLQIYMKDYLRAAMTCIQQFYQRGVTNYADLHDRITSLQTAKKHMDTYLVERHWDSRTPLLNTDETTHRLILTPVEVNKYIYTIEAQSEVTKFLFQYHDNYENITSTATTDVPAVTSTTTTPTTPQSLMTSELPTLFGTSRTKGRVASLILLCGNNVHDGYGLAFRIIQHFKLDAASIYTQVTLLCAQLHRYSSIRQLLSCIRESGICSDAIHDDVIAACVKVMGTDQSEVKEQESLIKLFRNDLNKISAYITCGKLKSAYLLAVKMGRVEDVKHIHQVAAQTGQQAVIAICQQYLQKRQGKH